MKIRKSITRILLVLLAVVAAVLVVRATLNFTEGRGLTRALAELKDKGIPLSGNDLAPPCPDGDNGALLWKAAEELQVMEGNEIKLLGDVFRNFAQEKPIDVGTWEPLARLIEKNRRSLDLLLEASAKKCFQYGDTTVDVREIRLPDALKMLRAMRLLGFEAFLSAEKGDMAGSLDRLRKGLRFAPKVAEGGPLIAYLIGLAEARICFLFLNKSLSGRAAGEELLLPFLEDLGDRQVDLWKSLFKNSVRVERVFFLDIGLTAKSSEIQRAFGGMGWSERALYWLIRPLFKRDIRTNLPMYLQLETQVERPYYRTKDFWSSYKNRLDRLPWYAFISKNLIPNLEAASLKVATLDALMLTSRVGLACRVYKSRTGEYPESLEALVPGLLTGVPVDPFTGDPLVYRREGEGFIVYSVGSNLKDDRGRGTWDITQMVMEKDDDWSWKEDK